MRRVLIAFTVFSCAIVCKVSTAGHVTWSYTGTVAFVNRNLIGFLSPLGLPVSASITFDPSTAIDIQILLPPSTQ